MYILLKMAAYIIFVLGALFFFFGGTKKPNKGRYKLHVGIIMTISIILISYYYWFRI